MATVAPTRLHGPYNGEGVVVGVGWVGGRLFTYLEMFGADSGVESVCTKEFILFSSKSTAHLCLFTFLISFSYINEEAFLIGSFQYA